MPALEQYARCPFYGPCSRLLRQPVKCKQESDAAHEFVAYEQAAM